MNNPLPESFSALLSRLEKKEALIGVVGLGYVGLPLSIAFCEAGCSVLGFDIDPQKPDEIAAGNSYLRHIGSKRIASAVASDKLSATSDFDRLSEPDAILICVPTPLTRHYEPDLSYVEHTAREIVQRLRPGQLIVLESTTYPGTTKDLLKPILEFQGLRAGQDFWLAFSPEREDPGNLDFSTATIPKIIGADDEQSRVLAGMLYRLFANEIVAVSTSATAEAVKLTENIFRSVNIALVNELKIIFSQMDINIWEVIDAAKSKPFGYMPFYPGPGLGGHCIPIDPFYLTWKAREFNIATKFIELAGQINSLMPDYVIDQLVRALDAKTGKGLNGSRILILGLAYKKNVDDTRESPALRLMELLEERGARTEFYDPFVAEIPKTREHSNLMGRRSIVFKLSELDKYDAVLIATDHDGIDYKAIAETGILIVDTRNACSSAGTSLDNVVRA